MEAMDIGMPCLVSAGTTFKSIAKNEGVGVDVSDRPEEIAQVILEVAQKKDFLSEVSRNASEYARQNFNWQNNSKRMVRYYLKYMQRYS